MLSFSTRHLIFTCVLLIFRYNVCFAFLFDPKFSNDCAFDLSNCNQSFSGWPAGATNLNATVNTNILHKPVFELRWVADFKSVRCFRIVIKSDRIPNTCQVIEYMNSKSNITTTYPQRFSTELPLSHYNCNYTIELYTLPQQNAKSMVISTNLTVFRCTKWQATYQYIYDGERIVITFDKGPQRCNFRNYSVTFNDEKHKKFFEKIVDEKKNSSKLMAVFSKPLCKGKYYIKIRKAWDIKYQGCLDFDGSYRECEISRSDLETYIPRIPCERDKISETYSIQKTNGRPSIIIWIICVLLIILAVLLLVFFLRSLQLKPKNRGIVFFVDDHPAHSEAVKRLVDYLEECHLNVSFASYFLKHHEDNSQLTILAEVLKSDFVILVVSSALLQRMEAWKKQQDYVEFFKEKNSNILTKDFLERIVSWNKLYLCKFDHVTEYSLWFEYCYSLPSHMNEMVKVLEIADYNFSSFKYFKKQILLNWFSAAVEKAADYELSNPEWFRHKYFCPKVIVTEENSYLEHTENWK